MVPVAAKVGALLAVAAAGSTSIWYFSDSIFGKGVISVADETESSYGDNSIGRKYGGYFLSSKSNENIWKKRFEENSDNLTGISKPKDKFGTVTEGYSDKEGNQTALNKVCDAVYKETNDTNLVESDPTTQQTSQFVKRNVWKFCALGDIVTVSEDSTVNYKPTDFPSTKIGGEDTNKKLFVSAKSEKNQWFWKLREEEFRKDSGDRSHSKSQGKEQSGNVFKTLKDDQTKTLSDTCHSAYDKTISEDSANKNKEDAELFCSIKLSITNS